jgi:ribosomal protein S18 acetylase RimI-like enzyme
MDFSIVTLTEEHLAAFHSVLDAVAHERRFIGFIQAPPLEETRNYFLGNHGANAVQLIAIVNQQTVGWCDIIAPPFVGFTHNGRLGMGVLKQYRRRGIGTRLVQEAIGAGRERGLRRIELEVYPSNTDAIDLYRRFGFEFEGRKKNARFLDGQFEDVDIMALLL